MMYLQDGLYVTIEEYTVPTAPLPKPLQSGFSRGVAYLVLGAFAMSESSDAFFVMANDRDEIWFISNRHLRVHKLEPGARDFRISLKNENRNAGRNGHSAKAGRGAKKARVTSR